MIRVRSVHPLPFVAWLCLGCATAPGPAAPPPTASGSKDAESIARDAVEASSARSLPVLRRCYGRELAVDPNVERLLRFSVHVDAKGSVIDTQFEGGPVANPEGTPGPLRPLLNNEMASCFHRELRAWHLPPTPWHGEILVAGPPTFVVGFNPTPDELLPSAEVRAVVQPIISRRLERIKTCWEVFMKRWPHSPSLRVRAHIVVSDRRVREVALGGTNGADDLLTACLVGELRALDFSGAPLDALDFHYSLSFIAVD